MRIRTQIIENEIARQARSYKEVASAAGITERTLKAARSGAKIQPATAGRIAEALGVSVETLLERASNENQNKHF